MTQGHYVPDAEFAPAPLGARGRITTLVGAALVFIALAVATVFSLRERPAPPWQVFVVYGIAAPVYAIIWYGTRVRRYRVTEDQLLVERVFRTVRLPLAGLKDATHDREAMRGAWKIRGHHGIGAIAGRFHSKRLGRFDAFVSDGEHAVVLRWPDRCVVISPEQHSFFIETVRKRAGLSR
jgi:hypothetical protein